MSLITEWIQYGENQRYTGYAARPAGVDQPLPAVIVLQEIWGVDEHIQDVTQRIAKAGYAAFAPDLFSQDGARPSVLSFERVDAAKRFLNTIPQSSWRVPEERQAGLSKLPAGQGEEVSDTLDAIFSGAARFGGYVEQITAASAYLREKYAPSAGQGVASVGFCLGGLLSATLAAQDPALRGAVIFYGNPPEEALLSSIEAPLLGLYGELDTRITDVIPAFADKLKSLGKSYEYHIYPGAPHAFFNDTRPSYHVEASRDAWLRTLTFLKEVLLP